MASSSLQTAVLAFGGQWLFERVHQPYLNVHIGPCTTYTQFALSSNHCEEEGNEVVHNIRTPGMIGPTYKLESV